MRLQLRILLFFTTTRRKIIRLFLMTFIQLLTFYETKPAGVLNYRHNYEMLYISLIVTTSNTSLKGPVRPSQPDMLSLHSWNPNVYRHVHKSPPKAGIQKQRIPVQPSTAHLCDAEDAVLQTWSLRSECTQDIVHPCVRPLQASSCRTRAVRHLITKLLIMIFDGCLLFHFPWV
jgi:hypothetical protein